MKYLLLVLLFLSPSAFATEPTLTYFSGRAVTNSINDESAEAFSVEQETPIAKTTWLFGYLNEGHKDNDKRDGLYAAYKLPYQFTKKFETSFALGPYFTANTLIKGDNQYEQKYYFVGLTVASLKYQLTDNWSVQGRWSHVIFSPANRDADVFLFGIGFSPSK